MCLFRNNQLLQGHEIIDKHIKHDGNKYQSCIVAGIKNLLYCLLFLFVDPYRITHPLDMENGYNNTKCTNIYNIQSVSAI